jgi:hypothetical protein
VVCASALEAANAPQSTPTDPVMRKILLIIETSLTAHCTGSVRRPGLVERRYIVPSSGRSPQIISGSGIKIGTPQNSPSKFCEHAALSSHSDDAIISGGACVL